jgi:hypothetical protein
MSWLGDYMLFWRPKFHCCVDPTGQSRLGQTATLLGCILEVFGSNIGPDSGSSVCRVQQFTRVPQGKYWDSSSNQTTFSQILTNSLYAVVMPLDVI